MLDQIIQILGTSYRKSPNMKRLFKLMWSTWDPFPPARMSTRVQHLFSVNAAYHWAHNEIRTPLISDLVNEHESVQTIQTYPPQSLRLHNTGPDGPHYRIHLPHVGRCACQRSIAYQRAMLCDVVRFPRACRMSTNWQLARACICYPPTEHSWFSDAAAMCTHSLQFAGTREY